MSRQLNIKFLLHNSWPDSAPWEHLELQDRASQRVTPRQMGQQFQDYYIWHTSRRKYWFMCNHTSPKRQNHTSYGVCELSLPLSLRKGNWDVEDKQPLAPFTSNMWSCHSLIRKKDLNGKENTKWFVCLGLLEQYAVSEGEASLPWLLWKWGSSKSKCIIFALFTPAGVNQESIFTAQLCLVAGEASFAENGLFYLLITLVHSSPKESENRAFCGFSAPITSHNLN